MRNRLIGGNIADWDKMPIEDFLSLGFRRWANIPSPRAIDLAQRYDQIITDQMEKHGWQCSIDYGSVLLTRGPLGYITVTWTHWTGRSVSHTGFHEWVCHTAAVAAFLARRKAVFYGIWTPVSGRNWYDAMVKLLAWNRAEMERLDQKHERMRSFDQ